MTYGENRIAPLVNDFVARYPELEVNLILTNQMLDFVAKSYDLAIRLIQLEDSTLMARRLASRTIIRQCVLRIHSPCKHFRTTMQRPQ